MRQPLDQGLILFHGLYPRQASLYPVFLSAPTWKRLPQPSWQELEEGPGYVQKSTRYE